MTRNRTTPITPDGQADANRERPGTVPTKGRGKKTAGRASKGKAKDVSARDSVAANTSTGAEAEIAELKGDSHAHI
jgi:hypothetical protein